MGATWTHTAQKDTHTHTSFNTAPQPTRDACGSAKYTLDSRLLGAAPPAAQQSSGADVSAKSLGVYIPRHGCPAAAKRAAAHVHAHTTSSAVAAAGLLLFLVRDVYPPGVDRGGLAAVG
mmetsp:Transcript_22428/g.55312  ORF Transcript_22428/g.55312 Transcript_22428/m.55312 type:complete len:119 (-) Transcript_22428:601-957(-)